jgi:hypothetical protein
MIVCYALITVIFVAVCLLLWLYFRTKREISRMRNTADGMREVLRQFADRLGNLEQGIVPDFEGAKAAVKAVNDFTTGLANIMGYDPMDAARKARGVNTEDSE